MATPPDGDAARRPRNQRSLYFAKRLRTVLDEQAVKHREVAERVGVTPQALSRWCNGHDEPTLHNLTLLARALNVTTDYLLGRKRCARTFARERR